MLRRLGGSVRFMASSSNRIPSEATLELWRNADCVCFDVDSTLITEEGIDVLAAFCGKGEEVAAWTRRAMGGSVPLEVALSARLELIKPSTADLARTLKEHPSPLSPGAKELLDELRKLGKPTYIVSGGFTQMINPVVEILGIPLSNVFGNTILFDRSGAYAGFDTAALTSRSGGKARAVGLLKSKHGYGKVVMVGDGATDMEARPPADLFIGYGGVVQREAVSKGADWFVLDFKELINALKK